MFDLDQQLSPADGTVVNFGYIENRRIESIKGATYSLDALLQGTGPAPVISAPTNAPHPPNAQTEDEHVKAHSTVNEEEFADVNGISYSLDDLMGGDVQNGATKTNSPKNSSIDMTDTKFSSGNEQKDASVDDEESASLGDQAAVAMNVGPKTMPWTYRGVPKPGNKMFFAVVYLGPGDYHRYDHCAFAYVYEVNSVTAAFTVPLRG